jgi:hypothetical protein
VTAEKSLRNAAAFSTSGAAAIAPSQRCQLTPAPPGCGCTTRQRPVKPGILRLFTVGTLTPSTSTSWLFSIAKVPLSTHTGTLAEICCTLGAFRSATAKADRTTARNVARVSQLVALWAQPAAQTSCLHRAHGPYAQHGTGHCPLTCAESNTSRAQPALRSVHPGHCDATMPA